jgi:hypothetical protein
MFCVGDPEAAGDGTGVAAAGDAPGLAVPPGNDLINAIN